MATARSAIALAVGLTLGFVVTSACGGPYSGAPDKLRMPRAQDDDGPDDPDAPDVPDEPDASGIAWDNTCRTNFFDTPTKTRNGTEGKRLADTATGELAQAEQLAGDQRIDTIVDSIATLRRSLQKDPYGPEATYKMAVAYTLLLKKKCALQLLDRLAQLEAHPKVWKEASRVIERALRDETFDPFRKEANRALGR